MVFDNDELVCVAVVVGTHGHNGQLKIRPTNDFQIPTNKDIPVFLVYQGLPVPFFIADAKRTGDNMYIDIGMLSDSEAAAFTGSDVLVRQCDLHATPPLPNDDSDLAGYSVIDENAGYIGTLALINFIPGNPVVEVNNNGRTIILPYSTQCIKSINHTTKSVHVDAPAGLIDIYLES